MPCFGVEKQTYGTIGEGHGLNALLIDLREELGQKSEFGSLWVGVPRCEFPENPPDVHIGFDGHVFVDVAVGHEVDVVLLEHGLYQNA